MKMKKTIIPLLVCLGLTSATWATTGSTPGYQINVTPVGTRAAFVTTTGTCGSATSVSIISVQDIGGSSDDGTVIGGEAFEYAILCGGTFDFQGCGTIISPLGQSRFHANGIMDNRGNTHALIDLSSSTKITSGKVTFGGDITAPDFGLHNQATVLGTKTQTAVPAVEIPDIDLTPYYNWALDHSEIYSGYSSSSSYTPNGEILWVDGDVTISGGPGTTFSGSIIATGDIHISGQVDVTPTDCSFALASRDGNITITTSGRITGLVYAKTGDLQHTANGEIAGQIIVNGNINKAGNSDIITSFAVNVPSPPGGNTITDYIAITAWQK